MILAIIIIFIWTSLCIMGMENNDELTKKDRI